MKIFEQRLIRTIDAETIQREGISSDALMERAASTVSDWIFANVDPSRHIVIMAGPGNNGGDGLVIARHVAFAFNVSVYSYTGRNGSRSADNALNFGRLDTSRMNVAVDDDYNPVFPDGCLVVDALFGTGLSRPLEGAYDSLVSTINNSHREVLSVDLPSGMGDEESLTNIDSQPVVMATTTIAFQLSKLAFFLPETEKYLGRIVITDIGLSREAMDSLPSRYYYTDEASVSPLFRTRQRFVHKGDMGRAMIFAGSMGMMGAAQLAAKACMRSGVGLLTVVAPRCGYEILQVAVPEAMARVAGAECLTWNTGLFDSRIKAAAIGPGIGRDADTTGVVLDFLTAYRNIPKVIDADALWHLASLLGDSSFDVSLLNGSVLTPHDAEFDHLTCPHSSRYERIRAARQFAVDYGVVVVLKGANTAVCLPDGDIHFNSTGNPGMATGGSGDVLTGIVTALLAQGYTSHESAIMAVYMHGKAADNFVAHGSQMALVASDIISELVGIWNV